jgi:hypothetical protein
MDAMEDDQRARAQLLAAEATLSKSPQTLTADAADAAELQKGEAIKHQITASLKLQSAQHKRQMAQM